MKLIILILIIEINYIISYYIQNTSDYHLYDNERAKYMINEANNNLKDNNNINIENIMKKHSSLSSLENDNNKKLIHHTMEKILKDTNTKVYGILGNNKSRYIHLKKFLIGLGLHYKGSHDYVDFIMGFTNLNMNFITDKWLIDNNIVEKWIFSSIRDRLHWFRRSIFQSDIKGEYYMHDKRLQQRSQLAHLFSFIYTLQIFVNSGHENMILLEDDVTLNPYLSYDDARVMLIALLKLPKEEWDVQYLGYCYECDIVNYKKKNETFYKSALHPLCTHSMLISRKAAIIFLHEWRPVWNRATDEMFLSILCKYGFENLKAIRPVQPIFNQRNALNDSYLKSVDLKEPFYSQRGRKCNRFYKACRKNYDPFHARQASVLTKEMPITPDFSWLRNESDLNNAKKGHATLVPTY